MPVAQQLTWHLTLAGVVSSVMKQDMKAISCRIGATLPDLTTVAAAG